MDMENSSVSFGNIGIMQYLLTSYYAAIHEMEGWRFSTLTHRLLSGFRRIVSDCVQTTTHFRLRPQGTIDRENSYWKESVYVGLFPGAFICEHFRFSCRACMGNVPLLNLSISACLILPRKASCLRCIFSLDGDVV